MSSTPTHPLLSLPAQQEALNLEVKSNNGREPSLRDAMSLDSVTARAAMDAMASRMLLAKEESLAPTAKRFMADSDLAERYMLGAGMPSAHIKISSRSGRAQLEDGSLVVNMEINGIMYQGVLFAQTATSHRSRLS